MTLGPMWFESGVLSTGCRKTNESRGKDWLGDTDCYQCTFEGLLTFLPPHLPQHQSWDVSEPLGQPPFSHSHQVFVHGDTKVTNTEAANSLPVWRILGTTDNSTPGLCLLESLDCNCQASSPLDITKCSLGENVILDWDPVKTVFNSLPVLKPLIESVPSKLWVIHSFSQIPITICIFKLLPFGGEKV